MADINDDIEKYLAGKMSRGEMHALEKKALNDPFLAEAIEGASIIPAGDFSSDVTALRQQITNSKVRKRWLTPLRIAAGVIIVFAATYLIYYFAKQEEPVAISQNAPKEATSSSLKSSLDSLPQKEKSKSGLLSLNQPVPSVQRRKTKEGAVHLSELTKPAFASGEGKAGPGQAILADSKLGDTSLADSIQVLVPVTASGFQNPVAESDKAAKKEAEEESKIATKDVAKLDASQSRLAPTALNTQKTISGKVTSADDGSPIPGANVLIQGINRGTVSDAQGNYQVIAPSLQNNLEVSSIGFSTKEVKVPNDQTQINIALTTDLTQLSEVIVVGYAHEESDNDNAPVQLAEPVGGKRAYKKYLEKNLHYPEQALARKIEGKVTLEFIVQPTGTLSDFAVLRGLDFGCSEEVIRLVKEGPAWRPSTQASVKLKSTVRVGVKFKLPK